MKPIWVGTFDERPRIVLLPDGRLRALFLRRGEDGQEIAARYSDDDGLTWGEPETLFGLPKEPGGWGGLEALVDWDGALHIFLLNDAHTGVIKTGEERQTPLPTAERRLDIWHTKSDREMQIWSPLACIWQGYTGALNSVTQLRSGRILLPFARRANRTWADRGEGLDAYTYMGWAECTLVYSDDAGATWHLSPAVLKVPTPNLHAYGAVEPVVLELKDGRVWMLLRTQLGRLYESFSEDGVVWSRPRPTSLISSDSPVGLVRLPDGRIVLLWNACLRYPYALGGRHVLHAAISADEGRSFRGYREVVRDPLRHQPPPPRGDHGTAYPFPALTGSGHVILTTGQGEGRIAVVRFDPEWLNETHQREDFSDGLDEWSVFGTRGVDLIAHPDKKGSKALWVRKADEDWPAAAVWNFPLGVRGSLRIRVLLKAGSAGAHIGLTDHFSTPFDQEDTFHNLFNLPIGPNGELPREKRMAPDAWHVLEFTWDCTDRICRVAMDGALIVGLPPLREGAGVCYLRLRSGGEEAEETGFLVDRVECDVM